VAHQHAVDKTLARERYYGQQSGNLYENNAGGRTLTKGKAPTTPTARECPTHLLRIPLRLDRYLDRHRVRCSKSCRTRPCLGRDPVVVCHRVLRDIQVNSSRCTALKCSAP
jgi:hypothetical protein